MRKTCRHISAKGTIIAMVRRERQRRQRGERERKEKQEYRREGEMRGEESERETTRRVKC